jgi:hypothetical protein
MFGRRKAERFSLLVLDEGEFYFDDFGALYYPPTKDVAQQQQQDVAKK